MNAAKLTRSISVQPKQLFFTISGCNKTVFLFLIIIFFYLLIFFLFKQKIFDKKMAWLYKISKPENTAIYPQSNLMVILRGQMIGYYLKPVLVLESPTVTLNMI